MGEVGGSEQLCLLPAHEELSQLNYPANSSGVQAAHICHTQVSSAVILGIHSALNGAEGSSDLCQTAQSPWEWQWRELGGLEEEDLLHSLWDHQAASVWKILVWAQTRADQAQEEEMCPSRPPQCPVLFRCLEKAEGERVPRSPWGARAVL